MHHKWQRNECGWKCFNLCIYTYKLTSCWSVFNNWSYVDSLGLNACKWVALKTGMNLFLWCGLVLFRLDETTNIYLIHIYIENTGHNEVISFDLLWKEAKVECMYIFLVYMHLYLNIDNEAFRLILSVAFLYLED